MQEPMDQATVKRTARNGKKAALEQRFFDHWRMIAEPLGLPRPEMQVRFHPERKWRFDFAFVGPKLAVEVDGGSFIGGGHNRGAGQAKDHEKQNEAVRLGWRVLRFGTKAMDAPECVVDLVMEVLTSAKPVE